MLSYFHRFSVFMWTGENDSNTLRVDGYFFENGKKNPFSKISGYVWTIIDTTEHSKTHQNTPDNQSTSKLAKANQNTNQKILITSFFFFALLISIF